MNPIKPKLNPPVLDLYEEIMKFQELHPEESNYVQKSPKILADYFKAPPKPVLERCNSPKTVQNSDSLANKAINFITEEMQKDRQIGINIAEVKPMLKNWAMKCVVL